MLLHFQTIHTLYSFYRSLISCLITVDINLLLTKVLSGRIIILISESLIFCFAKHTPLDVRVSRVRFPAKAGNFSLHHRVQTGSGAHPASYPMGTGCSFPGGKVAGV
jgi:hypothetical protein